MSLPQNEHPVDRLVRVVLGVALVAILVTGTVAAPLSYLVGVIAAIAVVTGLTGFCPLYALLHVGTRSVARR
jgi:Inner membrane protein YgaP-like, transmembrane domain